jgi:hypothetical protein
MSIWHFWPELGWAYELFFIILSLIGIYSAFVNSVVLFRLRSIADQEREDSPSVRRSLTALSARLANMRQLLLFAFYLIAWLLFLSFPDAGNTVGDGRHMNAAVLWFGLFLHFAMAANVFFLLLVLHLLQWFVSSRVNEAAMRLETAAADIRR